MSHGKLRENKTCLNCGHQVEERFCPHCGQENTETRQPFHFLFTHFIEDFTHYDSQFWGTLKNLFFRPGALTTTYLEGKRQKFVPPVKLYIFISFISFFLFALFPPFSFNFETDVQHDEKVAQTQKQMMPTLKANLAELQAKNNPADSAQIAKISKTLQNYAADSTLAAKIDMNRGLGEDFAISGYKNQKSFDSAAAKNPSRWDFINLPVYHKLFELKEQGVKKSDILKSFVETALHNLPKALFIYLPVFAFFLWLFQNKKKWWYFDHGIFTLHYFSFLLLTFVVNLLLYKLANLPQLHFAANLLYVFIAALLLYSILYFYLAFSRVYKTHFIVSLILGSIILFFNYIAFTFLLIGLAIISFLMMH